VDLKQYTVFDEYYFGLKANGWSKQEAAKAARRHVNRMTPRQINMEVNRILSDRHFGPGPNAREPGRGD
jgi:hypothetical protein